MKIDFPKRGKYIIAVSGGVDSMVLLDLLAKKSGIELVVAHFNHGIRQEAGQDEALVRQTAQQLGLAFEVGYGNLGPKASEEAARVARYEFLGAVRDKYGAKAIIAAHHQDDLIETALLNLLRGTGISGLVAISTNREVLRPLLGLTKKEIIDYAKKNKLNWREDPSNTDNKYLRNHLRNNILPNLTINQRSEILKNLDKVAELNTPIKAEIANLSQLVLKDNHINRGVFVLLPTQIGKELVAHWLRERQAKDFDKKTVGRIDMAIRTFVPGAVCPVKQGINITISKKTAQFTSSV